MAIVVEHDKRKREILEKSLDVFVEEGYEDATFQKIADRCGITRTTLYLYFRNKKEIFLSSIKQLTEYIEESLIKIVEDPSLSAEEKLKKTSSTVLTVCFEHKKLFNIILMYLIHIQKSGKDVAPRVRRRIIRLRHIHSTIIIEGKNSGEFKGVNVKTMNETIYTFVEAAIFRLAVLNSETLDILKNTLDSVIESLIRTPTKSK